MNQALRAKQERHSGIDANFIRIPLSGILIKVVSLRSQSLCGKIVFGESAKKKKRHQNEKQSHLIRVSIMNKDRVNCAECGREVDKQSVCIIDEKPVCITCLYGDTKPFEIYPIGKVRTELGSKEISSLPTGNAGISCIDLLPSQKKFMYKLEEETSLLIVYYLHKVNSVVTVFPRRLDGKEVGVFASRTPNRLSKIAVQDVKLLRIEGPKLYVEGLDAMDGSPILDIKLGLSHRKKVG